MKEEFEVQCGNCRHWMSWKTYFARNRHFIKKAEATGLDGRCCCYESGMEVGPKDSSDTISASHCKFYENTKMY